MSSNKIHCEDSSDIFLNVYHCNYTLDKLCKILFSFGISLMTSVMVCQLLHQWVARRSCDAAHVIVVSGHHDVTFVSPRCTPARKKEKSNSFIFFCCFSVELRYKLNHREPQHLKCHSYFATLTTHDIK